MALRKQYVRCLTRRRRSGRHSSPFWAVANRASSLRALSTFEVETRPAINELISIRRFVLPFVDGPAACFAIHFPAPGFPGGSNALFTGLGDLSSVGVYGTPGNFFLTIRPHPAPEPEPSPLLLLLIGLASFVLLRRLSS